MNSGGNNSVDNLASLPVVYGPGEGPNDRTTAQGPNRTDALRPGTSPSRIPGYRILGEIARGGMGIVLAAHDVALERDVAIKILIAGDSASAATARFVRESKIAAKLAHPSIPPVHALGTLPDGSPFLAMKLIRGKTLAELLIARASPQADLPRFLQVFEQVAQAVGFAHTRGIIHRDLKPMNIMVGEFGEVQVMDWGLAKSLGDPDLERATDSAAAGSGETLAGTVLGTPAYMAPEQARGEAVDARADVFALGGILCVILTGSTPFDETLSVLETIQLAASGNTAAAMQRLDACQADPELIALAKRCLAPRADDRPADAGAVATAVAAYRADVDQRLHDAEARRAAAEAREIEQRKRRRAMMAASAIIGLVLAAGAGVSLWQALRANRAEQDAREQLVQTERARDQARQRYDIALEAFDSMIFAIQEKLRTRPNTLELRRVLLADARTGLEKLLVEAEQQDKADRRLVFVHIRMGEVEESLGHFDATRREYQTAYDLAKRLADDDPGNPDMQVALASALRCLGENALHRRESRRALEHFEEMYRISQRLLDADPTNIHYQDGLSHCYSKLGEACLQLGDVPQAHDYYQRKRLIADTLATRHPRNEKYQRDLALSYQKLGDSAAYLRQPAQALDYHTKALAINEKLLAADPQNAEQQRSVSVALTKLGNLHQDLSQPDKAHACHERGLTYLKQLAAADRQNVKAQTDLLVGYDNLGATEEQMLQFDKAAESYRQSRLVILPLHEKKLLAGQFVNALADVDEKIADCLRLQEMLDDLTATLAKPNADVTATYEKFAEWLVKSKDAPGLVALATSYARLAQSDAKHAYAAARVWCRAAEAMTRDPRYRDDCAAKAMALLKLTPGDPAQFPTPAALADRIEKDPVMNPLHERADFKAFVKALRE